MNNALRAKLVKRLKVVLAPGKRLDEQALRLCLADVRDLLDVVGEKDRFKVLKFHCDWVVHPSLTGPRAQQIIKAVDVECAKSMEKAGLTEWPDSIDSHFFGPVSQDYMNNLLDRFTLYSFESELREFLSRHKITILPDPPAATWRGFELVYCQLVSDRTWDYTNKKDPVRHVNRLRLTMENRHEIYDAALPPGGRAFPLCLRFEFSWGDEPRLRTEVEFLSVPRP